MANFQNWLTGSLSHRTIPEGPQLLLDTAGDIPVAAHCVCLYHVLGNC